MKAPAAKSIIEHSQKIKALDDRYLMLESFNKPDLLDLSKEDKDVRLQFYYELAYAAHKTGHYDKAIEHYEQATDKDDPTAELTLESKLALADIDLIRGRFEQAQDKIKELAQSNDRSKNPVFYGKAQRLQGHIHRFNYRINDALDYYSVALEIAIEHQDKALEGATLTSMAEALCWMNRAAARRYAQRAIFVNGLNGFPIEEGKAQIALLLAKMSPNGEREDKEEIEWMERLNKVGVTLKDTGYKAGMIFALQADAISEHTAGRHQMAHASFDDLLKRTKELGAYGFYDVIPNILLNQAAIADAMEGIEWIKPLEVAQNIEEAIDAFYAPD